MSGPLSGDSTDKDVPAVKGTGTTGSGVSGVSQSDCGVKGYSDTGTAVYATTGGDGTAIYARSDRGKTIESECVSGHNAIIGRCLLGEGVGVYGSALYGACIGVLGSGY